MISREERLRKAYLKSELFNTPEYNACAAKVLEERYNDDARRDITVELVINDDVRIYGIIKSKAKGVLAGLKEVLDFYSKHDIEVKVLKKDGDLLEEEDIIAELRGNEKNFLKLERTGLNIMQRMSGIATQTKKFVEIAKPYGVAVVGTRKTLLNHMDKKSIFLGGGLPHRMGLYDAILIKDNHISAIKEEGIEDAVETAIERAHAMKHKYNPSFIEVEVSTFKDAITAAKKFKELKFSDNTQFIIMLDNMKPLEIKNVVAKLKEKNLYDYVLLEASGMITEENIESYARSGVDAISVGALTHSVKALDISQKIVRREK